jgi:hypothetical protein
LLLNLVRNQGSKQSCLEVSVRKKATESKERIVKKMRMDVDEASHEDLPFHLKKTA